MRGYTLYVRIPDERALRRLDELARQEDESVARAAGRVVAGVLGVAFDPQRGGRFSGHYEPARFLRANGRNGPRSVDPIHVCCTVPMREALNAAARANGLCVSTMFAMLLHGALGVPWRAPGRHPVVRFTPEDRRRRNAARWIRYYERNREEILRSRALRRRDRTDAQRAAQRSYQRAWYARKRAEQEAGLRFARPAGW